MKVLLVSINSKYVHSSLAGWYLASALRQEGLPDVCCNVMDTTVNQPIGDILAAIAAQKPDILGLSCYIWNIEAIRCLLPQIAAQLPGVTIVLGGPEVSFNPVEHLRSMPEIEYIIAGEGEIPFSALIRSLATGQKANYIPGLCFRDKNTAVSNPPGTPCIEPPSPYSGEYFKNLAGRIAYLETSRGCPFSCSFCLSGESGSVRFFDLENAKRTLLLLANTGSRTIKLVDRTFNCNPHQAFELFSYIIKNAGSTIPEGVCFHFEVAADLFDNKMLDLLAAAPPGLIQLEAGLQSFHAKTLEAVGRKTDMDKLKKNITALLQAQNIHLHIDLIAGLPYESIPVFASSFNQAYALSPHMLQLGFLKLLFGSRLRSQAEAFGLRYSPKPPYAIQSSPWLTENDIHTLQETEYAVDRFYNSGRFSLTTAYLIEKTGLSPFAFYTLLGKHCLLQENACGASLDAVTQWLFLLFSSYDSVDSAKLRDVLVCDRIAADNTGRIPSFLKITDPQFGRLIKAIKAMPQNKNKKTGVALLYSLGPRAVYADYTKKDPVSGRYHLSFIEEAQLP